jgi:hypothetical protein
MLSRRGLHYVYPLLGSWIIACGTSTATPRDGGATPDATSNESAPPGDASSADACVPFGGPCTDPFSCCSRSCSGRALDDGGMMVMCN